MCMVVEIVFLLNQSQTIIHCLKALLMINCSFSFLLSLIEKLRRTKYLHRSVAALSMEKTNDAKE